MVPLIELRGITQTLRTGRGPERCRSHPSGRARACARRRERRRQEHARQDPRRHLSARSRPDPQGRRPRSTILGPIDAQRQGIAVVHQHPALFPDLSVAENIFVGRQPRRMGRDRLGRDDGQAARAAGKPAAWTSTSALPVKMLSIAERQSVEIVKALSFDARVLVMDEPTSAISGRELDRLLEIVRHLQAQGVAILFISHFLDEILGLERRGHDPALRHARRHLRRPPSSRSRQTVRYMIGTEPGAFFPKEEAKIGEPVLSVRDLSGAGFVEDVSFDLRAGEILGFFGLVGAGRSEVAEMLFGITRPDRGEIRIDGKAVRIRARRARRCGSASRSCPRIATSRASCCNSRSAPTRRCRCCADFAACSGWSTREGGGGRARTSPSGCGSSRPASSS